MGTYEIQGLSVSHAHLSSPAPDFLSGDCTTYASTHLLMASTGLPCCCLHHEGMQSRSSCRASIVRLLKTLPPKLQAKFYLLIKLALSRIHHCSTNLALGTASVCGLCYTLFMLCSYKTMLTGYIF